MRGAETYFQLNGRNFHGDEALRKCIYGIIEDGKRAVLINVSKNSQAILKAEFGENVLFN